MAPSDKWRVPRLHRCAVSEAALLARRNPWVHICRAACAHLSQPLAEFLRIDFPRIPFPEKQRDFDTLSDLGWDLVQAHLLKSVPRQGLAQFEGRGDYSVEKVSYAEAEQAITINASQRFRPVPKPVWAFHIGGYPVLEKYLKSRKRRKLSLEEIDHVAEVADALAFTIAQMAEIDKAYRRAFGA